MKMLAGCAALCLAAATLPPGDSGFTVHEWGTFTSVAAGDGSAAQWYTLGCGGDPPDFVNFEHYRGWKVTLGGTVRMETPVIYFYSPHEMEASVKVSFPNGLMTEWYPSADNGVFRKNGSSGEETRLPPNLNGIDFSMRNQGGVLEWKSVKVEPQGSTDFPVANSPNRYYSARATDAATVQVGDQREKFLFYRGVANIRVPLGARVMGDGGVVIESERPNQVGSVFLFENRGGAVGYRKVERLYGYGTRLDRPERFLNRAQRPAYGLYARESTIAQIKTDLKSALIAEGLYPKEAAAMIDTWRDSWFEEGSRLIYVLPTSTVDEMLPLEVLPKPMNTQRVFVGRIELMTQETQRVVQEAIARSDTRTLLAYQRFFDPITKSIGLQSRNVPADIRTALACKSYGN